MSYCSSLSANACPVLRAVKRPTVQVGCDKVGWMGEHVTDELGGWTDLVDAPLQGRVAQHTVLLLKHVP